MPTVLPAASVATMGVTEGSIGLPLFGHTVLTALVSSAEALTAPARLRAAPRARMSR
jgi:hypothetical protein